MAVDAALRRGHREMLGWTGLALGSGVAGLLILPFVAALLLARRVPMRVWPIAPVIALAMMLPDGFMLSLPPVSDHAPAIWTVLQEIAELQLPILGLACATTIGAAAAFTAQFSVLARHFAPTMLLRGVLLCTLLLAGLMPGLSSAGFLLPALLSLALAWHGEDRDDLVTASLVQAGVLLALTGHGALAGLGAVAMIAATVRAAQPLLNRAANDNPILARAT